MPRIAKPIAERLWQKVDKTSSPNGCWLWTGCVSSAGYGQINQGGKHGTHVSVHRLSWLLRWGWIPDDVLVCHKCDVKCCVNPDHLFLGTQADNVRDRDAKRRTARGERSGQARLTDAQIAEIRALYKSGRKQVEIAPMFGIRQGAVSDIVRLKTRKHPTHHI